MDERTFLNIQIPVFLDTQPFNHKPQGYEISAIRERQKKNPSAEHTMLEIYKALENGQTIVPSHLEGGISNENWKSQQLFFVDVDNKEKVLHKEDILKRCKDNNITPCYIYHTFSSTEENPRYRVIFCLDEPITSKTDQHKIITKLITLLDGDEACKDGSRIFFGAKKFCYFKPCCIRKEDLYNIDTGSIENIDNTHNTDNCNALQAQDIINNFPFEKYLKGNFPDYDLTTHKMKECPICGHNDCFSYDTKTNRVTCFSENGNQGKSMNCIDFIQQYEKISKKEAWDIAYQYQGLVNPVDTKTNSENSQELNGLSDEVYMEKMHAKVHLKNLIYDIENDNMPTPIPTHIKGLDETLNGGLRPNLHVLGAVSSAGKTTLALQIADNIAKNENKDVLFFSLEQTPNELLAKIASKNTYILLDGDTEYAKTQTGILDSKKYKNYSQKEKDIIKKAFDEVEKASEHLFIYEGHLELTFNTIKDIVEKHTQVRKQSPVIIVDYLQLITSTDNKLNDIQTVRDAVFGLSKLARHYNTPVITLSSFNRASYKKEADMSCCKDSSSIEYTADVLLALSFNNINDKNYSEANEKAKSNDVRIARDMKLSVLKNRAGVTGTKILLDYYSAFNYFKDTNSNHSSLENDTTDYNTEYSIDDSYFDD